MKNDEKGIEEQNEKKLMEDRVMLPIKRDFKL